MNADMPDNGYVAKFARYIGIDYSGAQTPRSSLPGLRVYMAEGDELPIEVLPPPSPRKYWTRRGVAEWLVEQLREPMPTVRPRLGLAIARWSPSQRRQVAMRNVCADLGGNRVNPTIARNRK